MCIENFILKSTAAILSISIATITEKRQSTHLTVRATCIKTDESSLRCHEIQEPRKIREPSAVHSQRTVLDPDVDIYIN
ncbi:unnamed protein product [Didymodactylos carnosus]|uniref:Uncharacterized protein n=1 Tax=Didymodactylos carnosus TaxID=1234261 RepID=A0A813WWG2_9BILA|nr:unnamed protein product [Didymodactylos carnosus]CAF0861566.1 unnamed protein product [Didymodactylos carnosus]CAF3554595.1 unnamed protein product [Didymodactylos carnosus]CAF3649227.1 unnamed protein product [Didymodactylos carnosus]